MLHCSLSKALLGIQNMIYQTIQTNCIHGTTEQHLSDRPWFWKLYLLPFTLQKNWICSRCQETGCALCWADVWNCGEALLWCVHSARRESSNLQCWIMPGHVSTLMSTDGTFVLSLSLSSNSIFKLKEGGKNHYTMIKIFHSVEVGNYSVFLTKLINIRKKNPHCTQSPATIMLRWPNMRLHICNIHSDIKDAVMSANAGRISMLAFSPGKASPQNY